MEPYELGMKLAGLKTVWTHSGYLYLDDNNYPCLHYWCFTNEKSSKRLEFDFRFINNHWQLIEDHEKKG